MTDSQKLLVEYTATGSEPAFRELVTRYIDLVYSAAFRLVGGDSHLADDVAQTVFLDLARQAKSLSGEVMLGGWLHRHTCFVASKALRGERRRRFHERQAAQMTLLQAQDHSEANLAQLRPVLDEAINGLGTDDRTAILLRFFEKCDFLSGGAALGSNEDTAQKRVSRALDKLRELLKRRGVALSAAGLATALSADAVTAAPAGLAVTISATAVAGTAAGTGTVLTLLKIVTMTNAKIAAAGLVIVAGIATPLVFQQQANAKARLDLQTMQQQVQGLDALRTENARLMKLKAQADELAGLQREQEELDRLRTQAATAQQQSRQLADAKAEVTRLRAAQKASQSQAPAKTPSPEEIPKQVVPRESWAFSGFATPETALQSVFWAINNGDIKTLMSGVGGNLEEKIRKDLDGLSEEGVRARAQRELKDMTGIGVVSSLPVSDDEVLVNVFITSANRNEQNQWVMKRVDGQWKLHGDANH